MIRTNVASLAPVSSIQRTTATVAAARCEDAGWASRDSCRPSALTAGGFLEATPLWFYVLKEAEVRANGNSLGEVGSRIVVETIIGQLRADPYSDARRQPTPAPRRATAADIELALASGTTVDQLVAGPKATGSPLYATFNGLWVTADREVERFRAGVEHWFDGEMQRLSWLYRRSARWVITVIAVLVALVGGLDALAYGKSLLSRDV